MSGRARYTGKTLPHPCCLQPDDKYRTSAVSQQQFLNNETRFNGFAAFSASRPAPPPFSAMSDVVNDSFIPKLYPQQQDSECRMVDRLLLQLVTSPIFLMVSSFSLFAIIVKRARDQQQKNARMERERLKRRI